MSSLLLVKDHEENDITAFYLEKRNLLLDENHWTCFLRQPRR